MKELANLLTINKETIQKRTTRNESQQLDTFLFDVISMVHSAQNPTQCQKDGIAYTQNTQL